MRGINVIVLAGLIVVCGCGNNTQKLGPGTIISATGTFSYRGDDGSILTDNKTVVYDESLKGEHCDSFLIKRDSVDYIEVVTGLNCKQTAAQDGHNFSTGTHEIQNSAGDDPEWKYVKADGGVCGTVTKFETDKQWQAYAFEDMSVPHYFPTRDEAEAWIKTWCKP